MRKLLPTIQYVSLLIACLCGLIFTVLRDTSFGVEYSLIFLKICIGWFAVFIVLLCVEGCNRRDFENFENSLV